MSQEVATDEAKEAAREAATSYIELLSGHHIADFRFERYGSDDPRVEVLTANNHWKTHEKKIESWASKVRIAYPSASLIVFVDVDPLYPCFIFKEGGILELEAAFSTKISPNLSDSAIEYHVKKIKGKLSEDNKNSLRPRWAEELRPKRQVKLRLKPELIEQVDEAAKAKGVSRNDWLEDVIQKAVEPTPKR